MQIKRQHRFPHLFQPLEIASMTLKNRIVLAPMGVSLGNRNDTLSDRLIDFYTRIAKGGTGLITTGVAAVSRHGTVGVGMNSLYDDHFKTGFEKLARAVHKEGARLCIHLMHGGLEAYPFYTKNKRLVSPSGGIFGPNQMRFKGMELDKTSMVSNEMTLEDMESAGNAFAAAAKRARDIGADAVELNGAQGFLLQQFYSAYFNKRTDAYGGCFENRMRFPLEVVRKVRTAVGEDFPILFRMVASEGEGGSIGVAEASAMAQILERHGVDGLHVTAGRGISPLVWSLMMPIAEEGHAPIINHVHAIRKAVSIPVIGVQRIVDPRKRGSHSGERQGGSDSPWAGDSSQTRIGPTRREQADQKPSANASAACKAASAPR